MEEETEKNQYQPATISFQSVNPGEDLIPGTPLQLKYNKPTKLAENMVYGQYDYIVREYDIPVPIRLEISNSEGVKILYTMKQNGGIINIPYILPANSELMLYVLNEVVDKQIVQKIN